MGSSRLLLGACGAVRFTGTNPGDEQANTGNRVWCHDALVVVDTQNDFVSPQGNLHVPGGLEAVSGINELVEGARKGGGLVACTQDWHPGSTPHFAKDGGAWPVHCVRDTWGAELSPDLEMAGPTVRKGTGNEDG